MSEYTYWYVSFYYERPEVRSGLILDFCTLQESKDGTPAEWAWKTTVEGQPTTVVYAERITAELHREIEDNK